MITYEVTSVELLLALRKAPPLVWDPVIKCWVKVDGLKPRQ